MTLSTYLLYVAAVSLLILTPGPTMLMCMANAVNHGAARAMASVSGALVASFVIMGLSALGLGALLAASEAAFTVLKVIGGCYLVWLGIRTFREGGSGGLGRDPGAGAESQALAGVAPQHAQTTPPASRARSFFTQGLFVGLSNPKSLLFFAAFFPQFIDPQAPVTGQFFLLALTFILGDFLVMLAAALGVGRIAPWLRRGSVMRWINRACGGLFALMGGLLLLSRRA